MTTSATYYDAQAESVEFWSSGGVLFARVRPGYGTIARPDQVVWAVDPSSLRYDLPAADCHRDVELWSKVVYG